MEKLPPQSPPRGQVASQRNFRDAGPHSALQLISQWTGLRNLPFNEHNTGESFVESALLASEDMASEEIQEALEVRAPQARVVLKHVRRSLKRQGNDENDPTSPSHTTRTAPGMGYVTLRKSARRDELGVVAGAPPVGGRVSAPAMALGHQAAAAAPTQALAPNFQDVAGPMGMGTSTGWALQTGASTLPRDSTAGIAPSPDSGDSSLVLGDASRTSLESFMPSGTLESYLADENSAVEMAYNTAEGGGPLLGQGGDDCLDIAVNQRIHSDFASQLARRRMESSGRNPLGQPDTEMVQACSERIVSATRPLRLATEIFRDKCMGKFLKWVDGQSKEYLLHLIGERFLSAHPTALEVNPSPNPDHCSVSMSTALFPCLP